ncbi:dipeptide/oligopeptide/nickel ABC transporter permease/ATP-binding protein [Bifidobacterium sp. SO4]|uniref:dipeptide/oligopeptide/nickel ABC transporter permease/ATP-binding protein n=1 Tax=Bifidobacterium sp. SO4 TaxID=2809030 RepID=UPI001BDBF11B|nr:dipeptide/oligopeptide/nickel ABC transporter permease/ATP-binding protein [Bifidobacterium sp. SO4]MBT1170616.1 dipeptide/oligopeptide/nickel ABC transporter permease/ATP-binding protein [Bifidobacterium sp. SO4]
MSKVNTRQYSSSAEDPLPMRRFRDTTFGKLLRNPQSVLCLAWLAVVLAVALLAPVISPLDPNASDLMATNAKPFSPGHFLGADRGGRDILSRLIWGSRQTLIAVLVVSIVSITLGVVSGLIAGFYRGWFETVADFISDNLMSMPSIVLLIALYALTGPNIIAMMAVFGVLTAPSFYRLVRSVVIGVRNELYVDAARVVGLSDWRIIGRHVLWSVRAPVIIQCSFVMASGIGTEAGLSFLGLGDPASSSWGIVLQDSFNSIYNNPGVIFAPAILVSVTILCFVLLGNSLSDILQSSARSKVLSRRGIRKALHKVWNTGTASSKPVDMSQLEATPALPVDDDVVMSIQDLHMGYPTANGDLNEILHGVSLNIRRGEIHGLVGESGSGKSQVVFSALGILPKEAIQLGGHVMVNGKDLLHDQKALRRIRGKRIGYVPQEPMSNLDPSYTIGHQLIEGIRAVTDLTHEQADRRARQLLTDVGIDRVDDVMNLYPFEISGGMAQRVLICGALAGDPDIIIADEPTTALDVTVQAEVLDILRALSRERGLAMILVTHNLGVVADLCDYVSVMKDGRIVEQGPIDDLFDSPKNEYTKTLLSSAMSVELKEAGDE